MMNKSYVQSLARCILVDSLAIPSLIFRARTRTFFNRRVKAEFSARAGLQVSLYFLYFKTFPIFPYLVCKCPMIPIIPLQNKNILKFMNFCWWNVTKTVNFSDHPRQKLVIILLLVHVNVLNLMLL